MAFDQKHVMDVDPLENDKVSSGKTDVMNYAVNPKSDSVATDISDTDSKTEETANTQKDAATKAELQKALKKQYRQKKIQESEAEVMKKEQWYVHLQSLLTRSQLYSKLLVDKIEKQKEQKAKIDAKNAKKAKAEKTEAEDPEKLELDAPPSKRRKVRRLFSPEKLDVVLSAPQTSMVSDSLPPTRQPRLFVGEMREYQLEGMEWLKVLHENGINGILADEMGLGKTVQVIALFAKLQEQNINGPFLVCAPLSTLGNWSNEFKRFTPHMKTMVYHGPKDERRELLNYIRRKNVIITSYEIVMTDHSYLMPVKWHYIVIDEGHRLKNPDCKFVDVIGSYKSENRLLLTGTPLQNDLKELWSLLNFLMPYLFDDLKAFQSWFDVSAMQQEGANAEIIEQERERHVIDTLHQILTPFLLRRTKAEVKLDIPPKKEILIYARMSALEEKYYKASLNRSIGKLLGVDKENETEVLSTQRRKRRATRDVDYKPFLDEASTSSNMDFVDFVQMASNGKASLKQLEGPVKEKITSVTNLKMGSILMHLKKIVTHPYLLDYPLTPEGDFLVDENLINNSGKLRILDSLLKGLKKDGHKVLIFSQFTMLLDVLHDYCVFREYRFCRLDGKMKMENREESVKNFNEDPEIFIFLLSTRAGGLGLNLTAADTVVIYDSDWNPQSDLQAQDRCHRFGQTKPVLVYRLVTANTVDEKVVTRAHAKRKLEKMIMMKGRFSGKETPIKKNSEKDTIVEHLEDLLKNMDKQEKVLPQDGDIFTEAQLAMLLDRSGNTIEESTHLEPCFKVVKPEDKKVDFQS